MKDYETEQNEVETGEDKNEKLYRISVSSFINDCSWAEVPNQTRNDRSQLEFDRRMHYPLVQSMIQPHNCTDSVVVVQPMVVLEKLEVDCSSMLHMDIVPNSNLFHQIMLVFEEN